MKVLIVDDEPLARGRLHRQVERLAGVEVVAEAANGRVALAMVEQHRPDVVLMDIRMPLMDGLQAAQLIAELAEPPAVIFCTAYNDYAIEAFEANAVGYLLKPVNRDKLAQALDKAHKLNRIQLQALAAKEPNSTANSSVSQGREATDNEPSGGRRHLSVKTARGIELVAINEIRCFLADHKYVTIVYSRNGELHELLTDDSLKELEQGWGEQLVRLHRNALVARDYLKGIERCPEGYRACVEGLAEGPLISRRHLPGLRKLLQQL